MARSKRRAKIISAARRLFYTKGYDNTTVRDILDEAEVTNGAFFHHFESKQALMEAVIDVIADELDSAVALVMQDDSLTAISRYQQLALAINTFQETEGEVMSQIWLVAQGEHNLRLMHHLRRTVFESFVPKLAAILRQGIEEGVFDIEFVDEAAEMVLGICELTMNGVFDVVSNPDHHDDPEKLISQKIQIGQTAVDRLVGASLGKLLFV
ncbi:MAG: TetR/AcrR family transcriptional regulator [Chloroflexota bacterium]